jgi:hypothetical protein
MFQLLGTLHSEWLDDAIQTSDIVHFGGRCIFSLEKENHRIEFICDDKMTR